MPDLATTGRGDDFFRAIVEASSDLVVVIGPQGEITYTNPAATRILGYLPEEVLGASLLSYVHEDDQPAASRALMEEMSGNNQFPVLDVRARAKNGAWVPLEAKVWLEPGTTPPRLALIARDMRVRQAAERLLADREAWAHAVLDTSPIAIITLDERLRVVEWSSTAERLYGWSADDARGQLHPAIQPAGEDVAMLREIISSARSVVDQTASRRRRDGTLLDVGLALAPLRRLDGTVSGLVELSTDLTSQRAIARQFERAQRLESLGRMATGVARDLERTITAIEMQVQVVGGASVANLSDVAAAVRQETEHARAMVAHLRELGTPLGDMRGRAAADDVLRDVANSLRGAVSTLAVRAELSGAADSRVPLSAERMRSIVDLLVRNARDAMNDHGALTLRSSERELTDAEGSQLGIAAGSYVVIEVVDSGPGIAPHTLDRIFEPFFTTRDTATHRGLGLPRALASARRAGGTLSIANGSTRGAIAVLFLPLVAHEEVVEEQEPPTASGRRRRDRAFVLDSNADQRHFARAILEGDGYLVFEASDAADVRRLADLHVPAVLVTPLLLPESTGRELAQQVRSLHPEVRTIYTSPVVGGGVGPLGPMDALLTTPFTAGELLTATHLLRALH
jgi:two-component system cell cycle sensor histidine kinase/response regulator CckA